jgi:YidC/Oxa1 family membrane protein insertase
MDTKRLITMMLVSFAVIFGWQIFIGQLYQRHPEWKRPEQATTHPATAPTTPGAGQLATSATSPSTQTNGAAATTTGPTMSAAGAIGVKSPATAPTTTVTLGENDPDVRMEVRINSLGAGVDQVTLKEFNAADRKNPYTFQKPYDAGNPLTRPFATRAVTVNGTEVPLAGVPWVLESRTSRDATFVMDLGLVKVRKIFQLTDKKAPGQGFELLVNYTVQNTSAQPAKVKIAFVGPTTPPHESEQGHDVQILAGYDAGYEKVAVAHHVTDEFNTKKPTIDLTRNDEKQPLLWGGTASVYFNAIVRPVPQKQGAAMPGHIASFVATGLNPTSEAIDRQVLLTFETTELEVAPKQSLALNNSIFLGPRQRSLLQEPYYAKFPLGYQETLVLTSGLCGFCTFQKVIDVLVTMLRAFHFVTRDWGLAIIILVCIVRALLHPITKRSQVSMMKMGKMGPEMERLKAKYPDPKDKDQLNKAMMELYKEQGFTPILGCLPMFLQMPIWIALYSALQTTFELRQARFLWGFTWIKDLAQPDKLIDFHRTITLPLGFHLSAVNLLPILMAVMFFLQQKFTPKPPAANKDQEMQQKMMQWMSLLFPVFLYNYPSGLNLYIFTSTTIGIIESKIIRDHIKQKDAEEKAGKIIVDAPKSMKRRRDDDEGSGGGGKKGPKKPSPPKKGLSGLLRDLMAKAEEVKREAEKKKG